MTKGSDSDSCTDMLTRMKDLALNEDALTVTGKTQLWRIISL